jgi:diaminohydroxyphosphoribosylaminopyrimidine deaminase/5-amino-6-(5-phosphoribosylamino)uracil reductase
MNPSRRLSTRTKVSKDPKDAQDANDQIDILLMERALFHAARGAGRTTPNPMVGAVVLSADGVVVGHGWHERAGAPHAEVHALEAAGERARQGTLYVTLEPCRHTGRTGPCTRRIIEAGVTRVVAAMQDPDPRVSGRGFAELRDHGIRVTVGVCEASAERLNEAFINVKTAGRPMVVLKAATSLDARVASGPGERTLISSPQANRQTQRLRAAVDAVAVGSETVLVDDPVLTVRECYRTRPLARVIFDRRLRTPARARLFSTLAHGPVIIVTEPRARVRALEPGEREAGPPVDERAAALEAAGAILVQAQTLAGAVRALLSWDIATLLVEGGPRLQAAFWHARLVDRLHLIVAPVALGPAGVRWLDEATVKVSSLSRLVAEPRGADIWIQADVHRDR